ncbi:hypothetical protein SAMD00019534_072130 [Acytostelium subglobosum LB1]|uniref:hypothetical protein n=1 Tax=Acytostelium subglobosum LB1 TaxID=1410327 RepID=UPI0006447C05|nr:hypothetical protein SAMD00019534_072130 [Acytostelium subglobosum LB1]GAM24038.1 hypothetical protein SAMD00019534_072130 [Acytostelium subglobosum LB1]|eukprot:XP_012753074.1 hypothetical protein SAMD00019534_072130 [Acytostelium subglobosum LB1]
MERDERLMDLVRHVLLINVITRNKVSSLISMINKTGDNQRFIRFFNKLYINNEAGHNLLLGVLLDNPLGTSTYSVLAYTIRQTIKQSIVTNNNVIFGFIIDRFVAMPPDSDQLNPINNILKDLFKDTKHDPIVSLNHSFIKQLMDGGWTLPSVIVKLMAVSALGYHADIELFVSIVKLNWSHRSSILKHLSGEADPNNSAHTAIFKQKSSATIIELFDYYHMLTDGTDLDGEFYITLLGLALFHKRCRVALRIIDKGWRHIDRDKFHTTVARYGDEYALGKIEYKLPKVSNERKYMLYNLLHQSSISGNIDYLRYIRSDLEVAVSTPSYYHQNNCPFSFGQKELLDIPLEQGRFEWVRYVIEHIGPLCKQVDIKCGTNTKWTVTQLMMNEHTMEMMDYLLESSTLIKCSFSEVYKQAIIARRMDVILRLEEMLCNTSIINHLHIDLHAALNEAIKQQYEEAVRLLINNRYDKFVFLNLDLEALSKCSIDFQDQVLKLLKPNSFTVIPPQRLYTGPFNISRETLNMFCAHGHAHQYRHTLFTTAARLGVYDLVVKLYDPSVKNQSLIEDVCFRSGDIRVIKFLKDNGFHSNPETDMIGALLTFNYQTIDYILSMSTDEQAILNHSGDNIDRARQYIKASVFTLYLEDCMWTLNLNKDDRLKDFFAFVFERIDPASKRSSQFINRLLEEVSLGFPLYQTILDAVLPLSEPGQLPYIVPPTLERIKRGIQVDKYPIQSIDANVQLFNSNNILYDKYRSIIKPFNDNDYNLYQILLIENGIVVPAFTN